MNTPTETPTPRVDAKIKHYYPTTHPHERPEEVVEADFARDFELELAAVTKERDDLKRAREINKEAIVLLVKERDEAYADRARLQEVLDRLPHHPNCNLMQRSPVSTAAREKWQEKGCTCFKAALSAPPPPVVPREDAEKLADALKDAADDHFAQNYGGQQYHEIYEAYRAKHPLP
jgi:hypothetical protein